jgi:hypothetical protein
MDLNYLPVITILFGLFVVCVAIFFLWIVSENKKIKEELRQIRRR